MKRSKTPSPNRRGGIPAFTKRDLITKIAKDAELTQDQARNAVQITLDAIIDTLLKGRVLEFRDFGVFEPVIRKARVGRNPKHPDQVVAIPERRSIKFRVGSKFRSRLEETEPKKPAAAKDTKKKKK